MIKMENKLRLELMLAFRYMEKKIKKKHNNSFAIEYDMKKYVRNKAEQYISGFMVEYKYLNDKLLYSIDILGDNALITVDEDYDDNDDEIILYYIRLTPKGKKFLEDNHMRKYIF